MALTVHIRRSDEGPLEGKAPAALLLHGWGGDERSMAIFETAFGPGWWLVRPRAPYPLPQGGYAWYPLVDGKPDPAALSRSLTQLIALLDELPQRFPIDPRRWLLVGFSQGGAMAARLALQAPERIAGLAVFSGFLPESPSPFRSPPLSGLPVFVAHGLDDPLVPVEHARQLCRQFQLSGAETTCVEYAGGHKTGVEAWRAFKAWLSRLTRSRP
ncbi:Putative hydrolase MhqD [Candidatus Thermoflexus japonica]|uniref:Hydrolase MhqD n=1 Tax=Candidatus Thermoflexus japonica TaxID=2035417 RepID=A0A2H5Y7L3_9CHLR|nr:Putative hydrolase MhqD [Candidatus Thermoflexus japonica]